MHHCIHLFILSFFVFAYSFILWHNHNRARFNLSQTCLIHSIPAPTVIIESPQNVLLNKSSNATLRCGVETDSAERSNLRVEWRKNDVTIDFAKDTRVSLNAHDFSLFIRHSRVDDTASYTCHANNGLDSADSNPAKLTVQGMLCCSLTN